MIDLCGYFKKIRDILDIEQRFTSAGQQAYIHIFDL